MPRGGYACSSALRAPGQLRLRRPRLSAHQSTPRVASADRLPGRRLGRGMIGPWMSTQVRSQRAARRAALPPTRAAARKGRRAGAARPVLQLLRPRGPELPCATRWKTVEGVRPKRRPVLVSAAIGPTLCGLCGHATSRPVWLARMDQPADGPRLAAALGSLTHALGRKEAAAGQQPSQLVFGTGSLADYTLFMHGEL